MRIYNSAGKLAVILLSGILHIAIQFGLQYGAELNYEVASGIANIFFLGCIYCMTRIFRTPGETPEPRPWWQMTGKPTAALWLALYFLSGTVLLLILTSAILLTGGHPGGLAFHPSNLVELVSSLLGIFVGILYYITWSKLSKANPRVIQEI